MWNLSPTGELPLNFDDMEVYEALDDFFEVVLENPPPGSLPFDERMKEIDEGEVTDNPDPSINKEFLVLRKRADTLGRSVYLVLSGGVCTLALLAYMAVGAVFKIEKLYGAGLLFLASTCLVAGSMLMFAMDVRLDIAQRVMPRKRNPAA